MTQGKAGAAEKLLDGLDETGLAELLDAVAAPEDAFDNVLLADLANDRAQERGAQDAKPGLLSLARGLLGQAQPPAWPASAGLLIGLAFDGHVALLFPGPELVVVALQLGQRSDLIQLRQMAASLRQRIDAGDHDALAQAGKAVHWAWRLDPDTGEIRAAWALNDSAATLRQFEAARGRSDLGALFAGLLQGRAPAGAARRSLHAVLLDDGQRYCELIRVPFVARLVVGVSARVARPGHRVWATARQVAEDVLRGVIGRILAAGLSTQMQPFPETEVEFEGIIGELRDLAAGDLDQRLVLGGFADHPVDGDVGSMRCRECIYYLPHRRWCDLPELPLPVEADWYCRLWKM